MSHKIFTVWVGGSEVNDYLLSLREARELAKEWRSQGYDDVKVDYYWLYKSW